MLISDWSSDVCSSDLREEIDATVERAKGMGRLAMIFLESPANPTNVLVDVDAVVAARNTLFSDEEEKPPIVIDNTFLGPLWQKPLRHGVDMVVYSLQIGRASSRERVCQYV